MEFMEVNSFHNQGHLYFWAGRSCLALLFDHYDMTVKALENKENTLIYIDFAKAFDKCDHGFTECKLQVTGITRKIRVIR